MRKLSTGSDVRPGNQGRPLADQTRLRAAPELKLPAPVHRTEDGVLTGFHPIALICPKGSPIGIMSDSENNPGGINDMDPLSNESLTAAFIDHDPVQLEHWRRFTLAWAISKYKNDYMVEPEVISQETMLKIFRHIASFDPEKGKATIWVITIELRIFLNLLRSAKSKRETEKIFTENKQFSSKKKNELLLELFEAIDLAEDDLELLRLFYVLGYTSDEIGEKLGKTPSAIRKALERIRNKIRDQIMGDPRLRRVLERLG